MWLKHVRFMAEIWPLEMRNKSKMEDGRHGGRGRRMGERVVKKGKRLRGFYLF